MEVPEYVGCWDFSWCGVHSNHALRAERFFLLKPPKFQWPQHISTRRLARLYYPYCSQVFNTYFSERWHSCYEMEQDVATTNIQKELSSNPEGRRAVTRSGSRRKEKSTGQRRKWRFICVMNAAVVIRWVFVLEWEFQSAVLITRC